MINVFFLFLPLLFLSLLEGMTSNSFIRRLIYFSAAVLFLFFIGFSYKIGVDWVEYTRVYQGVSQRLDSYEFGYVLLNKLLNHAGIGFWFFSITVKVIYTLSVALFFYLFSKRPSLSLTIFVGVMFAFFNDPLRQLISSSILLLSFVIIRRNIRIVGLFLGSLFHSSFIILFLTWISKIDKRKIIILLSVFSFAMIIFLSGTIRLPIVGTSFIADVVVKINFYMRTAESANFISALARIFFLMYVCFSKKVRDANYHTLGEYLEKIFWTFSILYLAIEVAFFAMPILPQRMRIYFIPFAIVLFSNRVYFLKYKFNSFVLTAIIAGYLSFSLYLFISKPIGEFYYIDNNLFISLFDHHKDNMENKVDAYWDGSFR